MKRQQESNPRRLIGLVASACALDPSAVQKAWQLAERDGVSLGRALERSGIADGETLVAEALADALGTSVVLGGAPGTADMPSLPVDRCRRWRALPVSRHDKTLRLAMVDPLDYAAIRDIEFVTNMTVEPVVTTETDLDAGLQALERLQVRDFDRLARVDPAGVVEAFDDASLPVQDLDQTVRDASLPPVVRLVNSILSDAARAGASDVHIEPQENLLLVRRRVDGMLHDALRVPRHLQDAIISRLKVLGGMDIAERRRPQDGRSRLRIEGKRLDLRLSTLPAQFGEKVVIRILDPASVRTSLEGLAMAPGNLQRLRKLLARPQGLLIVTGPTGSGKTTTLHAALQEIWSPAKNVVTLEDPIEYRMPGLNQVQVNPKAGVTFASGLRSILRQDPNVVLVGEIRDRETGAIVLEAAQTGHLLLSTLHANDAPGAVMRLVDLGLEPFLVASSLSGVLAQRLARTPCPDCVAPCNPSPAVLEALQGIAELPADGRFVASKGCASCGDTGYRGRIAIHELLMVNDDMRALIAARGSELALRHVVAAAGMTSLVQDGVEKASRGLTTLEEVLRVAPLEGHAAPAATRPDSTPFGAGSTVSTARLFAVPSPRATTVLVIDDSPVETTVVRYFLEAEGYRVITAPDGVTGLDAARSAHPDVVVSDIDMPGMNGLELVRALRREVSTRSAAIILLTNDAREETELHGLADGADDFLCKPVNPGRLKARIQAVLARLARRTAVTA